MRHSFPLCIPNFLLRTNYTKTHSCNFILKSSRKNLRTHQNDNNYKMKSVKRDGTSRPARRANENIFGKYGNRENYSIFPNVNHFFFC